MHLEVTVYQMDGRNEIVSYLLPDNSTENRNSGRTLHRGVEYSLLYTPSSAWTLRFGGTNALHQFVEYTTQEGSSFDGNRMPNAPTWVANAEAILKPVQVPGLRLGLEWQRISSWYKDDANRFRYADRTLFGLQGVSVLHLRAGYTFKGLEVYTNVLNLTNEHYAHNVTRGRWGDTFVPAASRTVALGLNYTFTGK
jgi:iron complex outermembrane recepter protein